MPDAIVQVLLIEDDEDDYLLVRDYLAEAGSPAIALEWVATYEDGLAALTSRAHDLALVDYRLGARNGLDLLSAALASGMHTPVIILTGTADPAVDAAAQAAGAADYLDKGSLAPPALLRAIRYTLAQAQHQTQLALAQEFLQATLDALTAHVAVLDETGLVLAVNAAWHRFATDHRIGGICGPGENYLTACAAAPPELSGTAGVAAMVQAVLAGESATDACEFAYRGPTAEHWFAVRSTRFPGDGPTRAVVVHEDITERRAAEAALRASEASLAEAQRIARLGNWDHDLVRDKLRCSDEIYRIGGYDPQLFVPTPEQLIASLHPDDRQLVYDAIAASLESDGPRDLNHRVVRPDGEIRIVHHQIEVVRDHTGRLVRQLGIVQDVTEQRALEARLAHQAFHDTLTGLPNRALFQDRLAQAIARAERGNATCAILLLDLDRFKMVNDSLGHVAGDHLLVAASARLMPCLRGGDTLARLGGDEFAVLLEDVADLPETLRVAERLHAALHLPLTVSGREIFVTASIGVALHTAFDSRPEDLIRFADVALYRAKEAGRACTEAFYPGMNAAALERLELEQDLRVAIDRDELRVYYQPKVHLTTGQVMGVEALVRWQHPRHGLVSPGEFIPLAEETGLIVPIGRWVLAEACCQLRAWQIEYPDRYTPVLAVNLSARQFRHPDLVSDVTRILAGTALPAQQLTLEVTETVAMARAEESIATLEALRGLGVRLAIDDFGTGYSSLAYLQRLPVDTLKIDRAFFREGDRNLAIIRAVSDLAHGLGLQVIAEGLETDAQIAMARAASCDLGQGYYFAPPLPAQEFSGWWTANLQPAEGSLAGIPPAHLHSRLQSGLLVR